MSRRALLALGAPIVGAGLLVGVLAGPAQARPAKAASAGTDAITGSCTSIPLPGVPAPFNELTICI